MELIRSQPAIKPYSNLDKNINHLLDAIGLVDTDDMEEKQDVVYTKVSVKEEKTMDTTKTKEGKKPFSVNINGDEYSVARGYLGTDGRIHIAPNDTFLIFIKKTKDGKTFPVAKILKNDSSWMSQLFESLANESKHPASKKPDVKKS